MRVIVLNWRDTTHPEGGGSERYAERISADLVADGARVEVFCARHPGSGRSSSRDGIRFRHAGGRWTVYPLALLRLLALRLTGRRPDVVLDVHNGIPFFARLVAGCPVVVLVHHVHREQWSVVLGRRAAALGWFLESRVSPRLHRGCQYIAVSQVTREELIGLGVRAGDIAVVHNGTTPPPEEGLIRRSAEPSLVVLGRLVPHKRVEHALAAVAALRGEFPGLTLTVVGEGWWRSRLEAEAVRLGVADRVRFSGFLPEPEKEAVLAASWLMLAPSVKEGWGLMVVEAAAHGVPAVAYRSAGGLAESIHDGRTGALVPDDLDVFVATTRDLLADGDRRTLLGSSARAHALAFSWRTASTSMLQLLRRAAAGHSPTDAVDPTAAGRVIDLRDDLRDEVRTEDTDDVRDPTD